YDINLVKSYYLQERETARELVHGFLQEKLGSPQGFSAGWREFFRRAMTADDAVLNDLSNKVDDAPAPNQQAWQTWLDAILELLLNGRSTADANPITQRGAKISLADAFLQALHNDLQDLET